MNLQMKSEMRHSKHLKIGDRKKEITEEDLRALMLGEADLQLSNITLRNYKCISYQIVHNAQQLC